MDVLHTHCAGLDVHKKTVVATMIVPDNKGHSIKKTRSFETVTASLIELSDWLIEHSITHVAMESTGVYWKPIYNILEDSLELALVGRVERHHRFILQELLNQIESLDATIAKFDQQILEYCRPFEAAVERLDTIPGVARETAEIIVSEIGIDMSRFPSADHLASWAGVAPGNHESAGKRLSGRTTKGNQALVDALTQAAWAASHTKNTYLSAQYRRIAARRGRKKALVAVAHSILVIAYHLLKNQETYHELGGDYFDKRNPQTVAKRLVRRLETLGYSVTLEQSLPTAG